MRNTVATVDVVGNMTIHRKRYLFGGEVVAIRVAGDPVSANNGLFYRYSDHLGSTSVLGKAGESAPWAGSAARHTPFGAWRTEPTQTITNMDYTGHQQDNLATGPHLTGDGCVRSCKPGVAVCPA